MPRLLNTTRTRLERKGTPREHVWYLLKQSVSPIYSPHVYSTLGSSHIREAAHKKRSTHRQQNASGKNCLDTSDSPIRALLELLFGRPILLFSEIENASEQGAIGCQFQNPVLDDRLQLGPPQERRMEQGPPLPFLASWDRL